MTNNSINNGKGTDSPQSFEDLNFIVNGKNYKSPGEMPPEVKQKLQEAMDKLRQNPGLFNMIGGLAGLAKTASQLGITRIPDLTNIINAGSETKIEKASVSSSVEIASGQTSPENQNEEIGTSIHKATPESYNRLNQQRTLSPTFNPVVKGDGLRKFLFLVIMAGLIGYLIFKYGFQGNLPV